MSMDVAAKAETSISWKDLEALPLYAAFLLFMAGVFFMLLYDGPPLEAASLKASLIFGALGLRAAWSKMDKDQD